MKIGIVTITDLNLGNRLQNYAVQELLKQYSQEVYTIIKPQKYRQRGLKRKFKDFLLNTSSLVLGKYSKNNKFIRRYNYINFDKNINFCNIKIDKNVNDKVLKKLDKKFDCFAVGSDQVWNPNFYNDNMQIELLDFTSNEKKIAVAPSIACDTLTLNQYKEFKTRMNDFDYLSCREQQGADLIREITGKECVSLVDPTLMLSADKWDSVAKKPSFHDENKRYLLLYFLGKLSDVYQEQIEKISKEFDLEIINVYDKNSRYFSCGPAEFIYLIKHSSIVLTDSFHGSVFSYIYDKPLRIFRRLSKGNSMNSRLTNLMDKLHLDDNIYFDENINLDELLISNYDKKYLKEEQIKFKQFLDNYFGAKI